VFPGADRIEQADHVDGAADAAIVLECADLSRPEVAGLDRMSVINVDHHVGNTMYGTVNWFDGSAAACGEMVADIIDALGVEWTREIATHLYLAIATDTGSFRHGNISGRTFEACRRVAASGVSPAALSRQIFDSFGLGRVRLTGLILDRMELFGGSRIAVLYFDDAVRAACGATLDDTEGLVNLPLGAREILAVALFKRQSSDSLRVSLRSKGNLDVRAVAQLWGGGGHPNASGLTIAGSYPDARQALVAAIMTALENS